MDEGSLPPQQGSPWSSLRRHPVITGVMVGGTVLGVAFGYALLPEEWSALRRLLAGGVAGAGTGLLITATKMLG